MRFLSLFSGIGAFDYGLERAGWTCAGQCEVDPYCRAVLEKHWPRLPRWPDVRTLSASAVRSTCGPIDAICGGFPCQPHSAAGKRQGEKDPRNLWPDFARLIGELGPRWVLAENVPGIRTTYADRVCEDLESQGYTVWPLVVGADDVGAPHQRKRVWFVGYRNDMRCDQRAGQGSLDAGRNGSADTDTADVAHAEGTGRRPDSLDLRPGRPDEAQVGQPGPHPLANAGSSQSQRGRVAGELAESSGAVTPDSGQRQRDGDAALDRGEATGGWVANASEARLEGRPGVAEQAAERAASALRGYVAGGQGACSGGLANTERSTRRRGRPRSQELQSQGTQGGREQDLRRSVDGGQVFGWPARPGEEQHVWEHPRLAQFALGSPTDGVASSLVRIAGRKARRIVRWANAEALKALGNAVVWQVAYYIALAITHADREGIHD